MDAPPIKQASFLLFPPSLTSSPASPLPLSSRNRCFERWQIFPPPPLHRRNLLVA
jgi:hypothetical protein